MNRMVKMTALASALAMASLAVPHFAVAKDKVLRQCIDCIPGGGGGAEPNMQNDQDQGIPGRRVKKFEQPNIQDDEGQYVPRKLKKFEPNDQFQQGGGDDNVIEKRTRRTKQAWKFDNNRHERRRYKDNRFRFYFDGFWYPRAYWDDYYYDDYIMPSRVSCREGAEIVSERFARVRIVECDGRVYTYLGRRRGDTFEIKLNSRTGRIVDAQEI
jgi:hypothetical protein